MAKSHQKGVGADKDSSGKGGALAMGVKGLSKQNSLGNTCIMTKDGLSASSTSTKPGYGLCTEFGDYWIIPNDVKKSSVGKEVDGMEVLKQSAFDSLSAVWDKLEDGSGKVTITETGDDGKDYSGFRNNMLKCLGLLLSKPYGRWLVKGLVNGSQPVTIMPGNIGNRGGSATPLSQDAFRTKEGKRGKGCGTTIKIDPHRKDDSKVVFNEKGEEISAPVFTAVGHELIHARHNAQGNNRRSEATNDEWDNMEEKQTIESGSGPTENRLREEHGLDQRHGHGGRVKS